MLTKSNIFGVLKVFFEDPNKKFHIRELARLTDLSPPGIMKIVKNLEKEKLVIAEKRGFVTDVCATRTDAFFRLKRSVNLIMLYESGLVDFLNKAYEQPEAIVLFGSYSKGEDTSKSDIDIAVVTNKSEQSSLDKFEKYLKRSVNLHEVKMSRAEKDFINTLANGIVLSGYLRAVA